MPIRPDPDPQHSVEEKGSEFVMAQEYLWKIMRHKGYFPLLSLFFLLSVVQVEAFAFSRGDLTTMWVAFI
jgi:hypothetical protein